MISLLLLAAAPVIERVAEGPPLCVPVASDQLKPTTSDIEEHRALRRVLGEPMPDASMMVMLHGKGGHLSTQEYSIIAARNMDGLWHGTAVGRSQISVKNAPYTPMKRAEWVLDKVTAEKLDRAMDRT
ncbi:hypothetical protein [Sphingobium aquiterrae]|uniref:hypothetical protein n=1 Tax=Sphingobium aquiterrae TaxID=2038656 RepID=UPI003018BCAF|tara:strand:+ start:27519 stop:27902 length:384 start_codon:yes stop_codon:yes gene_type:complete